MGIDWKLLIAQAINFAILLFLLQRFAYKPIIGMLEKRRENIRKSEKYADEMEAHMKKMDEAKEEVLSQARAESTTLMKRAEENAVKNAEKIVADAKAEALRASAAEQKKLAQERDKLREDLRREVGETVAMAIEKSVGDVMDKGTKEKLLSQAMEMTKR